ncbi:MAG TPA: asparagine synthase-related protein, partial [Nitrospirota bacterium]
MEQKWERLTALLRDMHGAVLAYSGGVDSSLVLRAAAAVMGPNLIAVTAESDTYPPEELVAAVEFARSQGVTHRTVRTSELQSEKFVQNSPERCYHCKHELFSRLKELADAEGIRFILDGSNVDDLRDHRPG